MKRAFPEMTYLIAEHAAQLCREGLADTKIAEEVGRWVRTQGWGTQERYSVSYINNLINAFNGLHPQIRSDWKAHDRRAITDMLVRLAKEPLPIQLMIWGVVDKVHPKILRAWMPRRKQTATTDLLLRVAAKPQVEQLRMWEAEKRAD